MWTVWFGFCARGDLEIMSSEQLQESYIAGYLGKAVSGEIRKEYATKYRDKHAKFGVTSQFSFISLYQGMNMETAMICQLQKIVWENGPFSLNTFLIFWHKHPPQCRCGTII